MTSVSGTSYSNTRPRRFAPWRPRAGSKALLDQVIEVLVEASNYLPVTARQVFYRLVGAHDYPKSEAKYPKSMSSNQPGGVSRVACRDQPDRADRTIHGWGAAFRSPLGRRLRRYGLRPSQAPGAAGRRSRSWSCAGYGRRQSSSHRRSPWRRTCQWAGPQGRGRSGCP
jgi:hypothetical protein